MFCFRVWIDKVKPKTSAVHNFVAASIRRNVLLPPCCVFVVSILKKKMSLFAAANMNYNSGLSLTFLRLRMSEKKSLNNIILLFSGLVLQMVMYFKKFSFSDLYWIIWHTSPLCSGKCRFWWISLINDIKYRSLYHSCTARALSF